ncbi:M20/M25/M40 family metallo-hydrolase [uncultured Anoxybacillus sp.]|uniref:M20/M25/M40 family metallo-hydrolase n=1 Tax=uncultured Anoxybacillus sp. TaxID=263860 RepID=UPI00263812BD|nr:M20/M25/M40 family metallo-hydrolase [uncultured Anoxybacillus sp.]
MKSWNQLFIRQGFVLEEKGDNCFLCTNERRENVEFLMESLNLANVQYAFRNGLLTIHSSPICEKEWIKAVDFSDRGKGEGLWFRAGEEEPKVFELDTYVSGLVRELNRLGLYTKGCCDGHGRRWPHIYFDERTDMEKVMQLWNALQVNVRLHRPYVVTLLTNRERLLDVAEQMRNMQLDWLEKGEEHIRKMLFLNTLEELLNIPGKSGDEEEIRMVVREKLTPYVDRITTDWYGNLLAQTKYRTGNGPTILLNAHLDTVVELEPGRTIMKHGPIWSSSRGILGADDRAGVAVLLEVAKWLETSDFNGTIKFAFTVEEECGPYPSSLALKIALSIHSVCAHRMKKRIFLILGMPNNPPKEGYLAFL